MLKLNRICKHLFQVFQLFNFAQVSFYLNSEYFYVCLNIQKHLLFMFI